MRVFDYSQGSPNLPRMDYAGLITKILLASGETQTDLARHLGVSQPTISRTKDGSKPTADVRERLVAHARKLGIIDGNNTLAAVPIKGYIGTAGEIQSPQTDEPSQNTSDMPPKPDADIVSVVVRGDDMLPAIENGWVVYYENGASSVEEAIGKLCIVSLADGRVFAKRLFRGSAPGTFNLFAPNGSAMMDQKVVEARRILWIKPA